MHYKQEQDKEAMQDKEKCINMSSSKAGFVPSKGTADMGIQRQGPYYISKDFPFSPRWELIELLERLNFDHLK